MRIIIGHQATLLHYSEEGSSLQDARSLGHIPARMHASISAFEPWLAQLSSSPSAVSVDWSALLTGDRLALSGISLVLTTLYFLKVCVYCSKSLQSLHMAVPAPANACAREGNLDVYSATTDLRQNML